MHFGGKFLSALILATNVTWPVAAEQLLERTFAKLSYEGSQTRDYYVFVPDGLTGSERVPVVMVLHGCKQTAQNMIDETGFRELARRKGFVVVYPFIKNYDGFRDQNCWGFWLDHHIHEGRGEVEDLYQIALEVERLGQDGPVRFALDPERRYVAGLSSGGAMAVVSAVAQSEYFAAAGSVAGLPYSETPSSVARSCFVEGSFKPVGDVVAAIRAEQRTAEERRPVPLMAIHSTNDCTVHERASENIRDAWLQLHGAATTPFETSDCAAEGVRCEHARYGRADRSVIETVFYEGQSGGFTGQGSHYWVGDNFGEFANPQGPSASALLWDFFERHSFGGNRPPSIAITAAAAQGTSVGVSGTANDDRAVAGVTVRLDGTHPQAARPASGTTSWSVTFDPVPNDAIYVPTATATDDQGRSTSATGEPVPVGTPRNQPPAITVVNVRVESTCVTVDGNAADPDGTVAAVDVELGSRGFERAALTSGGRFTHRACGLPPGIYATRARVTDDVGASTLAAGGSATILPIEAATANWQAHMGAGRIRVYQAPCSEPGFGTCDAGFQTIFSRHGFAEFVLHKHPETDDWYLDPAKIR